MSPAETLREAKALLHNESRWCQSGFAKNAAGGLVEPNDPYARSWCSGGAVMHVRRLATRDVETVASEFNYLARAGNPAEWLLVSDIDNLVQIVADVNDHAEKRKTNKRNAFKNVHKMFDKAIAMAEASA